METVYNQTAQCWQNHVAVTSRLPANYIISVITSKSWKYKWMWIIQREIAQIWIFYGTEAMSQIVYDMQLALASRVSETLSPRLRKTLSWFSFRKILLDGCYWRRMTRGGGENIPFGTDFNIHKIVSTFLCLGHAISFLYFPKRNVIFKNILKL